MATADRRLSSRATKLGLRQECCQEAMSAVQGSRHDGLLAGGLQARVKADITAQLYSSGWMWCAC